MIMCIQMQVIHFEALIILVRHRFGWGSTPLANIWRSISCHRQRNAVMLLALWCLKTTVCTATQIDLEGNIKHPHYLTLSGESTGDWWIYLTKAQWCISVSIESTKTTSMEDVSTGVLEKNKEFLRNKDKAKNDMMYPDIYSCICQNTKKMKIY